MVNSAHHSFEFLHEYHQKRHLTCQDHPTKWLAGAYFTGGGGAFRPVVFQNTSGGGYRNFYTRLGGLDGLTDNDFFRRPPFSFDFSGINSIPTAWAVLIGHDPAFVCLAVTRGF